MAIENLKYHLILALLIFFFHIAFWRYIASIEPCMEIWQVFWNFDRIMAIENLKHHLILALLIFSYSFLGDI
jgi:hypothetical protein